MNTKSITIHIKGGKPLRGEVQISPNKNAILPAIAASVLTDKTMTYLNVPWSPDVEKMLQALDAMGASIEKETATVTVCCKGLRDPKVPSEYIHGMQAGYLFAGPLLARFGEAFIPLSTGCQLGYRGPEDHYKYLSKLGVNFAVDQNMIHFSLNESITDERIVVTETSLQNPRTITYNSPHVTPTENVLMLLAKTSRYNTKVIGVAQEPHVVQLISLLRQMGAQIKGQGSIVSVTGMDTLSGAEFITEPDHVDYFGFAVTAAMTQSDLLLRIPTITPGIAHMNEFMADMGIKFEIVEHGVMVLGSKSSFSPSEMFPRTDADRSVYLMNPGPWPGFPVDCLPSFIAFSSMNPDPLTSTRSHNWMYTDGLKYVDALKQMGAKITLSDEQKVIVQGCAGGNPYREENVRNIVTSAPSIIEGTRAIHSAALAGGWHTILNAQYILRRQPNYFKVLEDFGAEIIVEGERVRDNFM